MPTRYLYIARHGAADPFGELTDTGREQARLLGGRLAHLPIGAVWHSPLPRAVAAAGNKIAHSLTARFATAPDQADDVHEVLITHAYQVAWLIRDALAAPPVRWLGLSSANAALTVIEYRPGVPPNIAMFNDMTHLPAELRWTGFPQVARP